MSTTSRFPAAVPLRRALSSTYVSLTASTELTRVANTIYFEQSLNANVNAGHAVNNPSVALSFPQDNSIGSQVSPLSSSRSNPSWSLNLFIFPLTRSHGCKPASSPSRTSTDPVWGAPLHQRHTSLNSKLLPDEHYEPASGGCNLLVYTRS